MEGNFNYYEDTVMIHGCQFMRFIRTSEDKQVELLCSNSKNITLQVKPKENHTKSLPSNGVRFNELLTIITKSI